MTTEQIAADIERGIQLRAEIDIRTKELQEIEERLEKAGLAGPHVPLENSEREGKQAILTSGKHKLRVRIESDNLVGGFAMDSDLHKTIAAMLTKEQFNALFKPVKKYERKESDGHKFRLKAKAALQNQELYLQLIKALRSLDKDGIPKSKVVIPWSAIETFPN